MNPIKKLYTAWRFTGWRNALRTLRYSLFRDFTERRYPHSLPDEVAETIGTFQHAREISSGARFRFQRAELEVRFLLPDLIRVSWEPGEEPIPYALAKTDWEDVHIRLEQEENRWKLSSEMLVVLVSPNGELTILNHAGKMIRRELSPLLAGAALEAMDDDDTEAENLPPAVAWTHRAILRDEECLFGLGEQAAFQNLRPGSYDMWNHDPGGGYDPGTQPLYAPMPVYFGLHSEGSYLVFYENYHPSRISFSPPVEAGRQEAALAEASFEGGMLRYYFSPGPPEEALERFTQLTGRSPLPPLWSLGYHQCRWGYKTEEDIREVVQGFREHELPLSAIHLDIDYMRAYRVFTIDETRFPDLAKLAKELADAGTRMVTILDPGVMQDPGFSLFDEGVKRKMFCLLPDGAPVVGLVWPGWSVFPDFTNPDVRAWWGEQYRRLLDDGIAGFWHDMNEPSCFTAWGGFTLPTPTQHAMEGRGGNHRQGHNLYGLLMDRAGYEGLRKLRPEQRPWLLSRSGWVGLQRFAWNWTGDTETSWQSLQMTIPTVLGLGFSGIPYSGPDIGGFSGNPSAELFVRWFHLACFLPFFRTHSATGTLRREPWVFGEPYTSIIRKILQLRYSLIPYLYSLAWESSQHGFPIVRPLFWKEPEQERLWQVSDAFLLGNSLLVAPILEEGSQERELSLPSGEWYHFWDDALFEAKQNVRLEAPLDRIPLLVRAGCVLPMDEHGELVLHVYPAVKDSDGEAGFLYSDEGDGYGDWRVDRFQMKKRAEQLNVLWEKDGEYPFSYSKIHVQFHGWQPGKVWVDDKQVPVEDQRVSITAPFHTLQTNR